MADEQRANFWTTLPGILTGLAALISAVAGLTLALSDGDEREETPPATVATRETRPGLPQDSATTRAVPARDTTATAVDSGPTVPAGPAVNLIAASNGGHLVAAASDDWATVIDGDEGTADAYLTGEAVFAFADDKAATFDTFGVLVAGTSSDNLHEYELSAGNAGPGGPFTVIGRFATQNIKLFKSPYQEVRFAPVTARYFKVKRLSTHGGSSYARILELRLR